jgi:competence protein ComFB
MVKGELIMEIHNISEDIVFTTVQTIFDSLRKKNNAEGLCLCNQCKVDTICYVLNRIEPKYIVSNRGITRIEQDWINRQQTEADVATLVYKGVRVVNHNQRPTSLHDQMEEEHKVANNPAFDIPTIVGRVFDGNTFAPLTGVSVELRYGNEIVPMRNSNWQNPFTLIEHTPGAFSFWPIPVPAEAEGIHRIIVYSLKVESPQYETMIHHLKIPSVSSIPVPHSYSVDGTFKVPDLYLFPPGEAEQNG